MIDIIKSALEYARDEGVSPLIVAWLAFGFLGLRLLAMIGGAVSRTASSVWSRYNEMLRVLELQLSEARREMASVKAELVDRERELERSESINALLRDQLERARIKRFTSNADEE